GRRGWLGRGGGEMRVAAAQALKGIGLAAASAIPDLEKALGHPDARVRRAAAEVLGQFGSVDLKQKGAVAALGAARATAPQLRKLLDDPDGDVRRAASDALLNLFPLPEEYLGRAGSVSDRSAFAPPVAYAPGSPSLMHFSIA